YNLSEVEKKSERDAHKRKKDKKDKKKKKKKDKKKKKKSSKKSKKEESSSDSSSSESDIEAIEFNVDNLNKNMSDEEEADKMIIENEKRVSFEVNVNLRTANLCLNYVFKAKERKRALEKMAQFGPEPDNLLKTLDGKNKPMDFGRALLPGEGAAMAKYVEEGLRIPRRGEIGLTSEEMSQSP
ncbi:MAG TPA: hypothetical protein PLI68_13620, partial [Bacteroidia bacterium]|nr:hypothetical protein [Bacteroidia bacterium]